jgi:predicted membrane-bound mannosyltransferase
MRAAIIFSLAILATSCGMIKNVTRHKERSSSQTDSTSIAHVDAEQVERVESVTSTTVELDTTATFKGSTVGGSISRRDLEDHPLVIEDETQRVTVSVDHNTGKITATGITKDKTIPLRYRKHTEQKVLSDRNTKTKTDTHVAEKKSTSSQERVTDKNVKRWGLPWYLGVVLFVIILIALYLTLRKRLRFLP